MRESSPYIWESFFIFNIFYSGKEKHFCEYIFFPRKLPKFSLPKPNCFDKISCFHILHGSPVVVTELYRRPTNCCGGYNSIQRCGRSGQEGGERGRGTKLLLMEFLRRYVRNVMAKFREGGDILMGREIYARVSSSRVALSSLHSDISPMGLQRSSSGHATRCRSATLEMIVRGL